MKNLTVDLIFWGWGNQLVVNGALASDAQQVLNNVDDIATWLNSGWVFDHSGSGAPPRYLPSNSGAGWEPAVHYYGVSGIMPGLWVNDSNPIPWQYLQGQGTGQLDRGQFAPIVNQALAGQFGAAMTFSGTVGNSNGLPIGSNRLTMVITKGTNDYCITVPEVPQWLNCETAEGFHWGGGDEGVPEPFGAVFSSDMNYISHEITEAMTDPLIFGGWTGTNTDLFVTSIPAEVADECTNFGDNDFAWVTVDPPYKEGGFAGDPTVNTSCLQLIPEQHAPMAATFEYGYRSQPLVLFYTTSSGHIASVAWSNAGQSASAPFDMGQPTSTVKAVGKPTVVYSMTAGGERLFVKGSDNGLWTHSDPNGGTGIWTSLGGQFYGDPKAVLWGSNDVLVTVLGTDDNLYFYSVQSGWYSFPAEPPIVGSPAVVSRTAGALDWFAVGEDGGLKWISYNASSGFAAPKTIANASGLPFLSTPMVVAQGANVMELFATSLGQGNMWQTSWNGSSWAGIQDARFSAPASNNYAFQGTPAAVSWGPGRFDVFTVSRDGELWWWYTTNPTNFLGWANGMNPSGGALNPPALVSSGVTGDPLAISRSANELEVFYRTTAGSLAHLTYANGSWGPPENLLPANSIQ